MSGEWQPIKTAPKDGKPILLYYESPNTAKLQWALPGGAPRFIRIGKWNGFSWKLDQPGHFRNDATHWMPLPEAPHD